MRQRAARETNLGRFDAIAAAEQPLELALNGGSGRLSLKCAFHVPNGFIQFALIVGNDAQANVGYEVIRDGRQYALENVHGLVVTFGFQISLAEQAIGFYILGESLENVTAMRDGLIVLTILDQILDQAVVTSQGNLSHLVAPP